MQNEVINLGTKESPQCINLGTDFTPKERCIFINLFKCYKDVCA